MRTLRFVGKKLILVAVIVVLVIVIVVGIPSCREDDTNKITKQSPLVVLVTQDGSMGDDGLNDVGWEACEAAGREMDIDIKCLESSGKKSVKKNLHSAAGDGANLVILMGSKHEVEALNIARDHEDTNFVVVNGNVSDKNLASIKIDYQAGGYLAGIAAAMESIDGDIGFIKVENASSSDEYFQGFERGIDYVRNATQKAAYIKTATIKSINSRKSAVKKSKKMAINGTGIIVTPSGKAGSAIIKGAKKGKYRCISTMVDQSRYSTENVLGASIINLDSTITEIVKGSLKGKFQGKVIMAGIKDGCIDFVNTAGNLSSETVTALKEAKEHY